MTDTPAPTTAASAELRRWLIEWGAFKGDSVGTLNRYLADIEAEARSTPTEALDVERLRRVLVNQVRNAKEWIDVSITTDEFAKRIVEADARLRSQEADR